jgi:rhodanese-related sulfurtransferase
VPRYLPGQLYRALEGDVEITVVDVRNLAAYNQARISDALHMPLEELSERAGELDGKQVIVFYDLSPNEAVSLKAAMFLYDLGFTRVAVLDGGLQRWYSDGYPIEGTLLTPTPGSVGPPWTVTPLPTSTPLIPVVETPTQMPEPSTVTPTATEASAATPTATEASTVTPTATKAQ